MYTRNCPQCNEIIKYKSIIRRNKEEKDGILCDSCDLLNKKFKILIENKKYDDIALTNEQIEYIKTIWNSQKTIKEYLRYGIKQKKENIDFTKEWYRICPRCGEQVIHTSTKWNRDTAEREKRVCKKCRAELFGLNHTGENNPFFGKKHTKESMDQMKETSLNSEKRKKHLEKVKTKEYRKHMSEKMSGDSNHRRGLGSLHDIWERKYGKEEADRRQASWAAKVSKNTKGEKNYWFGKTPPHGTGNGWCGWYKGWFFRSLHELSYMIKVIEAQELKWENAEQQKYKMQYIDKDGQLRNYFSDFIIEGAKMVEVKPTALHTTLTVLAKQAAAIEFCKKTGLIYELIDPEPLTDEELMDLYTSNQIIFTKTTQEKFAKKYLQKPTLLT